jgi:hypothetical protein
MPPAAIPAPVIGPPQGDGKTIAALMHAGTPDGLHAGATQLRQQATELSTIADQLRSSAAWSNTTGARRPAAPQLPGYASSPPGMTATPANARAAAAAAATATDNYGRAKAAIPTPQDIEEVEQRLATAQRVAAADPRFAALYAPVITQLSAQRANLEEQATTGYTHYQTATEAANLAGTPLRPPPQPHNGGSVQAVDRTWKKDPPPTPTPTTTSTAPMPECDLDDVAKLHRKLDDFKRRYTDFLTRAAEHNKPHYFV